MGGGEDLSASRSLDECDRTSVRFRATPPMLIDIFGTVRATHDTMFLARANSAKMAEFSTREKDGNGKNR